MVLGELLVVALEYTVFIISDSGTDFNLNVLNNETGKNGIFWTRNSFSGEKFLLSHIFLNSSDFS